MSSLVSSLTETSIEGAAPGGLLNGFAKKRCMETTMLELRSLPMASMEDDMADDPEACFRYIKKRRPRTNTNTRKYIKYVMKLPKKDDMDDDDAGFVVDVGDDDDDDNDDNDDDNDDAGVVDDDEDDEKKDAGVVVEDAGVVVVVEDAEEEEDDGAKKEYDEFSSEFAPPRIFLFL